MVASAQVTLLMLTARKADCELGISIDSMHKMSLSREQSQLSSEYYSKLQAKKVCYYANGQYQKMNYEYLMGGANYLNILNNSGAIKTSNSMILADYKGQVVLSDDYANIITSVLGSGAIDASGRGSTFAADRIPEMLKQLSAFEDYTIEEIKKGVANTTTVASHKQSTLTGKDNGASEMDITEKKTANLEKLLNFYLPILKAASANGWTTEYNKERASNDDYISDALVTGTFQLENVNEYGDYDEGTSLTYFLTNGAIQERTDSSVREEITAWYNAEKERIAEKENYIDIHMSDLSTELEAINTEIQSIQSFIDDGLQVLDWGTG